ncbi:PP-loop family-domain-containing protein [Cantharellus anzutake]|uniref:PP-loop family-domain-containing protein n=1 Tax=Cantharellus anzutake TaxID=1750568 RepID=UPI0019075025|nr:PP-loop family-domain-containing protein [Cantharellus anzutake]KAF8333550.1 PP-loop family-domain-containing protein [Cantharellus anzutake]
MFPISRLEFLEVTKPLLGPLQHKTKLALAFSGGADSLCLLFLLHRLLLSKEGSASCFPKSTPPTIVAFTIDHGLQRNSKAAADQAAELARRLSVEHHTISIPWDSHPFPSKPLDGSAMEQKSRDARYHLMFAAMQSHHINWLGLGHHADDQVETAVMRLSHGSAQFGLSGMRPIRRWGMGGLSALTWAGLPGMTTWIARPLLTFPKERIIATCSAEGLQFITDITNFQPSLTIRNSIRATIAALDSTGGLASDSLPLLGRGPSMVMRAKENARHCLSEDLEESTSAQLHRWVTHHGSQSQYHEKQASEYISKYSRPSPPSTLLLCTQLVPSPEVQAAIILRVLRYVSPNPWGHNTSQSRRKATSIALIASRLWPMAGQELHAPFAAGSQVLWASVPTLQEGLLLRTSSVCERGAVTPAWLAVRQPLYRRRCPCHNNGSPETGSLCLPHDGDGTVITVVFDLRFLIRITPHANPLISRLKMDKLCFSVSGHGPYHLPLITLRGPGLSGVVIWKLDTSNVPLSATVLTKSEWLEVKLIRSLEPC